MATQIGFLINVSKSFLKIKAPQLQDKENVDEKKNYFSVYRTLANPHSFSQNNYLS